MKRDPLAGVHAALEECQAYFDERADAENFAEGPLGNDEMRLLIEVEVAMKLLKEVREGVTV